MNCVGGRPVFPSTPASWGCHLRKDAQSLSQHVIFRPPLLALFLIICASPIAFFGPSQALAQQTPTLLPPDYNPKATNIGGGEPHFPEASKTKNKKPESFVFSFAALLIGQSRPPFCWWPDERWQNVASLWVCRPLYRFCPRAEFSQQDAQPFFRKPQILPRQNSPKRERQNTIYLNRQRPKFLKIRSRAQQKFLPSNILNEVHRLAK